VKLLNGTVSSVRVQVAPGSSRILSVALPDTTTPTLGVDSCRIDTAVNACAAMASLDTALDSILTSRRHIGQIQEVLRCSR